MFNWDSNAPRTGGIKYRENWHTFKGSVAGFAGSGIVAMAVIHWVVLTSPGGHARWMHVAGIVTGLTH
jgi:hypothetical protein